MTQPLGQFLGTMAITSLATIVYFTGFALLAGSSATTSRDVLVRAAASLVVGAFLTISARQRETRTARAAAADGFALAIVVVVCNSLFGSDYAGRDLAIRTVGILTGVPALAALSHTLARRGMRLENQSG